MVAMALGTLVKSKDEGLGTVTKVTRLEIPDEGGQELMPHQDAYRIRTGDVVSVRWQSDPTKQTTHVFYDGQAESFVDMSDTHMNICLVEKDSED